MLLIVQHLSALPQLDPDNKGGADGTDDTATTFVAIAAANDHDDDYGHSQRGTGGGREDQGQLIHNANPFPATFKFIHLSILPTRCDSHHEQITE